MGTITFFNAQAIVVTK